MENKDIPSWLISLEKEDLSFIKKFILSSGSLKDVAKEYNVSYPTVRLRLDRLIQKIELNDTTEDTTFINFIKQMTIEDRLNLDDAKLIIDKYKEESSKK